MVKVFRFRPLPGDLISQYVKKNFMINIEKIEFPSPSRGSYFSIYSMNIMREHLVNSFRPLPGDLISQSLY